jgi:DNA-binding protein HU-beta
MQQKVAFVNYKKSNLRNLRRNLIMNKDQLGAKVAEILTVEGEKKVSKKRGREMVDAVLQAIAEALKAGEKVKLQGFGNFEAVERAARKGRNPQTGEEIEIAAKKAPKFSPAKDLKQAVNS